MSQISSGMYHASFSFKVEIFLLLDQRIGGFQCHVIQNRSKLKKSKLVNRLSPESGNRKKVDTETLAKIQVIAILSCRRLVTTPDNDRAKEILLIAFNRSNSEI